MKSYTLKILLLITSLTAISCMPDSATKFKEDPPKKAPVVESGGTVIIPADFHPTAPILCPSGNGDTTTENAGVPVVAAAALVSPFTGDTNYVTSPYSSDGTNNPNHEFIVRGDNLTTFEDLSGNDSVTCILADDSTPTVFHPYDVGSDEILIEDFEDVVWTATLPTGLAIDSVEGGITGTISGYSELAAYTITATNEETGTVATAQIGIASSTPLKMILDTDTTNDDDSAFFYTQYPSSSYTAELIDASVLIPNHFIINEAGAMALIDHIDYETNIVHLTIQTPTTDVSTKYFKEGDAVDQFNPDQITDPAARVFGTAVTTIDNFFATVKTGSSLGGTVNGDNFALHWNNNSGFVSSTVGDGLTANTNEEINKWIRCSYTPSIDTFGIDFANGEDAIFGQFSDIDNWGEDIATAGTTNGGINLDKPCEFNGVITSPFSEREITTTVYTYAGEEADTSFNLQAADIKQPRPLKNTAPSAETNFFFHYQYAGSDSTKLIITVDDASSFSYNSQNPDENKISNGRGTSAVITFMDVASKKLFVTLENNQAYAFVKGDEVDNTGTFLSDETTITDIEYTFELGKVADANSYFEPKIALVRSAMALDIDAGGTVITPFGANEFSTEFLKQVYINGSLTFLGDTPSVQSRTIQSINLSPNSHSITVSTAFSDGIEGNVSQTAYVSPYENAYEDNNGEIIGFCETDRTLATEAACTGGGDRWIPELGNINYTINNYSGVSTGVCGGRCDANDQVLAGTTGTPQIVFKPGTEVTDADHGRIVISNDLNTLLSTQTFEVTATGFAGNAVTSEFKFSVSAPPANLSLNRNLLLNVPSGSSFTIGSYVSSNNADAGLGIVKDVITAIENNYEYLDIQVIKGQFEEFDDIDSRQKFNTQKTYILGDGVIKYNAAVELGSIGASQEFDDALKCTTNKRYNRFIDNSIASFDDASAIVSGSARGTIAYQWDIFNGDTSQLRPTANNRVYLQVESGELASTDSLLAANCATSGAFDQGANAISQVISDNMYLEYTADTDFITGLNITSDDGANRGAGIIHFRTADATSAANDRSYIGQFYHSADGIFLTGQNIDNINPFVATEQSISVTALDHTFYLYRYEEASIEFNLGIGANTDGTLPSDTVIEFLEFDGNGYCSAPGPTTTTCGTGNADCSSHTTRTQCETDANFLGIAGGVKWISTEAADVPSGLTFDTGTGRIFGTPAVNSDKQKYILRVTNPYGVVEHNFELKVYDQYKLAVTDTDTTPKPDTYKLHQIGYGMASVPCRVTREALSTVGHANSSDVTDLTCALDAGESDLHANGINLTIRTGDAMCSSIKHTPFYFYSWQFVETSQTIVQNTGDFADPLCGTQPAFEALGDANPAGANPNSGAAPAAGADLGIEAPVELCEESNGGSNYLNHVPAGPNCDSGTVTTREQNFTLVPFACEDDTGTATADSDFSNCRENAGVCVAGGDACASCPGGDCNQCTTRTVCQGSGNTWNFNNTQHNDGTNAGTLAPTMGCDITALETDTEDNSCGGSQGACIAGAGKDVLTDGDLANRAILSHNMLGENLLDSISYDSPISKAYGSNLRLANYMNSNSCIGANNYDFDWTNWVANADTTADGAAQPFAGGRNHYEYSCDDGSGTIARIRMLVRDFDNSFTVADLIEGLDLAGTPNRMDDVAGGGDLCAFPGSDGCNERSDWDSFYNSSTGCGLPAGLDFNFGAGNFPETGL